MLAEIKNVVDLLEARGWKYRRVDSGEKGLDLEEWDASGLMLRVAEVRGILDGAGVVGSIVGPGRIERGYNQQGARLGSRRGGGGDRTVCQAVRIRKEVTGGFVYLHFVPADIKLD